MIRPQKVWRRWARRQAPIAVLLMIFLVTDWHQAMVSGWSGRWWVMAGAVAVAGLALVAAQWPVGAGLTFAAGLVVWSAVLRLVGAEVGDAFGGSLTFSEAAAAAVGVVAAVRLARPRVAAGVVAALVAGAVGAQVLRIPAPLPDGSRPPLLWDMLLAPRVILLAVSVAVGWYLRRRDDDQAEVTRVAVSAARERERLGLARELHDVVAHHVGVMVVQAQAAQAVAGTRPETAAEVLPAIEAAGSDALAAMRRLVIALREDDRDRPPTRRTTDLVADLRIVAATPPGGGVPVRLDVVLDVPVPAEVSTSVLRLVQESVTNARRHATGAHEIVASVWAGDGVVRIQVYDDGRPAGAAAARTGGYGLVGMRERVQLLGGRFRAGRAEHGGWEVAAEMPLREAGRSADGADVPGAGLADAGTDRRGLGADTGRLPQ